MRKTEEKRQRTQNEALARRKVRRTLDEEEDSHTVDDIAIPDYVMRDFGSLEEARDNPDVRRRAPEASEVSEDSARSHGVARENLPRKQ